MLEELRSWLVRKGWIKARLEDILDLLEHDELVLDRLVQVDGPHLNISGENNHLAFTFRSNPEEVAIQIRLAATGDLWLLEYLGDSVLDIMVNNELQAMPSDIRQVARHIKNVIRSTIPDKLFT